MRPTINPTTGLPTYQPTRIPTTMQPTRTPTYQPTRTPTMQPTRTPTYEPTRIPTTMQPTRTPTYQPTRTPTYQPTGTGMCIEGQEVCASECECGKGYYECVNGNWMLRPMPEGTVCAQNDSYILIEFSCPEYGDAGKCNDHLFGDCKCERVPPTYIPTVFPTLTPTITPTGDRTLAPTFHPTGTVSNVCVTGVQICVSECECGAGYYECVFGRWIVRPMPDGTICSQNDTSIIAQFSCPYYGAAKKCSGRISGRCNCIIPTYQEINPTTGLPITDTPTTRIPVVNPTTGLPTIVPTTVKPTVKPTEHPTDNGRCQDGYQRCVSECECGDGYLECVNGIWLNRPLPSGVICSQFNSTAIEQVFACPEYGELGNCEGKVHGTCPCASQQSVSHSRRLDDAADCIDGTQKCVDECRCGRGYRECVNGQWVMKQLAAGTVCAQVQPRAIEQVSACPENGNCGKCEGLITGSCDCTGGGITETCTNGARMCKNECQCGSGYRECVEGVWCDKELPAGTICSQCNATGIELLFACPELGECGVCEGKVTGNCGCVTPTIIPTAIPTLPPTTRPPTVQPTLPPTIIRTIPPTPIPTVVTCVEGLQRCVAECMCGEGYYQCTQGEWVFHQMAAGTVCAQNGTRICSHYACPENGSQGKCTGLVKGVCGCIVPTTAAPTIQPTFPPTIIKTPAPTPRPTYVTCVEGLQRCVAECICGEGYYQCTQGEWKLIAMPTGTVCAQNSSGTIELDYACPENGSQGRCTGRVAGSCGCVIPTTPFPNVNPTYPPTVVRTVPPTPRPTVVTCVEGLQRCVAECQCGEGYYQCTQGQWVLIAMPTGTVCAQNGSLVASAFACPERGSQAQCAGRVSGTCNCEIPTAYIPTVRPTILATTMKPIVCVNGEQKCVKECECGSGYYQCVDGQWVTLHIPSGVVCAQNGSNIYTVFGCAELGDMGKCKDRCTGNCNCIVPTRAPTVRPTTRAPTSQPPVIASPCIEGQQFCSSQCECDEGYYECVNGGWLYRDLPVGTVCAQNATEIIVEFSCPEAGSSGLCTGYVKGNCNCKIVPTLLPTGNVIPTSINQPCTDGNQLCSEQCNCEGNYYECVNHAWEARILPFGTVCAQNGTEISIEFGCKENGAQPVCEGKVSGNCGCGIKPTNTPTPTLPVGFCRDGEQFCASQCECGNGYYECVQGSWLERPLPVGTVCAQNGTEINLAFSCEEYGEAGVCEGRITGQCSCRNVIPTILPTVIPTIKPTAPPTYIPTYIPTVKPTYKPTKPATYPPTVAPTVAPTYPTVIIGTPVATCNHGEQLCVQECGCGSGYYECVNGQFAVRELAAGTICRQYNSTCIESVYGCPHYGSVGLCEGRITGTCPCVANPTVLPTLIYAPEQPTHCTTGNKRCISECSCGNGYQECINESWESRNLPTGLVCSQKGTEIRLVSSSKYGYQGDCKDRITGDCSIF